MGSENDNYGFHCNMQKCITLQRDPFTDVIVYFYLSVSLSVSFSLSVITPWGVLLQTYPTLKNRATRRFFNLHFVDVTGQTIAKLCGLPDEVTEIQSSGNSLTLRFITDLDVSDGRYNVTLSVGNMAILSNIFLWFNFDEKVYSCTERALFVVVIPVEEMGNCLSNPCVNGACKELPYSFTCDCTDSGYKGDRCQGTYYP